MADFTITTTANFDAGTKSQKAGVNTYEIETNTDNPTITAGEIQFGNRCGANFNLADADADNWKWTPHDIGGVSSTGYTENIDTTTSDELYMTITGATTLSVHGVELDSQTTGDFDMEVEVDITSLPATAAGAAFFQVMKDRTSTANRVWIGRYRTNNVNRFYFYRVFNGSNSSDYFEWYGSDHLWFRLTRVTNTYRAYYKENIGDSWTEIGSGVTDGSNYMGNNLYVELVMSSTTNYPTVTANFDAFKVNSGTLNTPYMTTGNWSSDTQTMTVGHILYDLTITHSGLDANNYIDKIEIYKGVSLITSYATNITSGASTTLYSSDFDSGFSGVDDDFTVKLYLVGDGTTTPIITQIEGNYAKAGGVASFFNTVSPEVVFQ